MARRWSLWLSAIVHGYHPALRKQRRSPACVQGQPGPGMQWCWPGLHSTTLPQKQKGEAGNSGGFWPKRRLMAVVPTLPNAVTSWQLLMLWWTPAIKLLPLLLHDCNFATVMNHNVDVWCARYLMCVTSEGLGTTGLRDSLESTSAASGILIFNKDNVFMFDLWN